MRRKRCNANASIDRIRHIPNPNARVPPSRFRKLCFVIGISVLFSARTIFLISEKLYCTTWNWVYNTPELDPKFWKESFYGKGKLDNYGKTKRADARIWFATEDFDLEKRTIRNVFSSDINVVEDSSQQKRRRKGRDRIGPLIHDPAYTGELPMQKVTSVGGCYPLMKWHVSVPTTCNNLHEINMPNGVAKSSSDDAKNYQDDYSMKYLFYGDMREAWLLQDGHGMSIVLKTLRYKRDFSPRLQEQQRKDAVASEKLTPSPHVVDIYGYCSMSVLNEYADGGDFFHATQENTPSTKEMLVYARDSAHGLAHIHGINNKPTLVHHDIRRPNFLLVGGKIKYHDFNQARFLMWNPKKNERCGFYWPEPCEGRPVNVYPRAPEECVYSGEKVSLSERVEVFRLGGFYFRMLTGKFPYEFETEGPDISLSHALQLVMDQNRTPSFPLNIENSDDLATRVIVSAAKIAMTHDVKHRPDAEFMAYFLDKAIEEIARLEERLDDSNGFESMQYSSTNYSKRFL